VAAYSQLGEHALGWLTLGLVGTRWDPRRELRPRWRRGALAVLASYGVNQTVKGLVRRQRPQLDALPQLTHTMSQLSFPSAHSTTGFAAARAYRGLLPAPLLYGVAGSLALSRLYLGVHYPSDVLAGAALGTAIGEVGQR
jgi:membrane-associated phospholipid phosphatase